ncbi:extracellular solute-binding protein [Actinomadura rubrisoli]|uniref:Extracellular solute-binding protein n=1 Tax=Actinomadura rubrisoli TaxID=2530368 RepID=A0A4R5B372_9ACTN|nr:extracellular solute-binding protein [Actinomadura rubrisoli]TDD78014.1 extracellular solute-binding protein [Actinomadura rubrisoli]
MSRRICGDLAAELMISVLLLAGCSAQVAPPEQIVTINWFASTMTTSGTDPRQTLIDAFQKANPGIRVSLSSTPTNTDEIRAILEDAIPGRIEGPSPDVYLGDVIWPAEFAQRGLAMPLDDRLEKSFWGRFHQEFVEASKYQGKIYAVPFYTDQGILLYRKDLLAREHLEGSLRTWEGIAAASRTLVGKKLIESGFVWQGAEYEGLTCAWTEFAADAEAIGKPAAPPANVVSRLDSAASLKAVSFMRSLLVGGASPEEVTSFREPQALQAFESGQAAFLRTWNSTLVSMSGLAESKLTGKVGVAPLPTFKGQPGQGASAIGGWSFFVNPNTRHLPEVLRFIRWMTSFPAQYTVAQYSVIPTNEPVRRDQVVQDNPNLKVVTRMRPVHRPSDTPDYPLLSKAVYGEVHQALRGAVAPETALRRGQKQIDRIRK